MANRVFVLDTETTGLSPERDRIVEFAVAPLEPRTGALGAALHRLVNPRRSIPAEATAIHGITFENVRNRLPFGARARELIDFVRGATVAMHNAPFDTRMLNAELRRSHLPTLDELGVTVVDTVAAAKSIYPFLPKYSLDALCGHLGISLADRTVHGAATDIRLLGAAIGKMSVDYDRWIAMDEAACAAELDAFQTNLLAFCEGLLSHQRHPRAAAVERSLSRVSAALRCIDDARSALVERYSCLLGSADWCCKHFAARWQHSQRVSWKSACAQALPNVDLTGYTTTTTSQTVKIAQTVADVDREMETLCRPLDSKRVVSSPHCIARAFRILDAAGALLEPEKATLRETLLSYVEEGYAPTICTVTKNVRKTVDYKRAYHDRVADPPAPVHVSTAATLRTYERLAAPCEALWGASTTWSSSPC